MTTKKNIDEKLKLLIINNDLENLEKHLIDYNIDYLHNNKTLLMITVENNNIKVAKLLFEKGANVNIKNRSNKTALSYTNNIRELIEILINNGADIEKNFIKIIKSNADLRKFIIHNSNKNISQSTKLLKAELIIEELTKVTETLYNSLITKNKTNSKDKFNKLLHNELSKMLLPDNKSNYIESFEAEYSSLYEKIHDKLERRNLYRQDFSNNYKEIIEFIDAILDILEIFCVFIPKYAKIKSLVVKSLKRDSVVELITNSCENIGLLKSIDKSSKKAIKDFINEVLNRKTFEEGNDKCKNTEKLEAIDEAEYIENTQTSSKKLKLNTDNTSVSTNETHSERLRNKNTNKSQSASITVRK